MDGGETDGRGCAGAERLTGAGHGIMIYSQLAITTGMLDAYP